MKFFHPPADSLNKCSDDSSPSSVATVSGYQIARFHRQDISAEELLKQIIQTHCHKGEPI